MINDAADLPVPGAARIDEEAEDPAVGEPDGKDWTWVLERPCAECGYDASDVDRDAIAAKLLAATPRWQSALRRDQVRVRPDPTTWSVLEYACHASDVHVVFGERTRLMLDQENPEFENWDQDQTATEKRYWAADPDDVAREIEVAGKARGRRLHRPVRGAVVTSGSPQQRIGVHHRDSRPVLPPRRGASPARRGRLTQREVVVLLDYGVQRECRLRNGLTVQFAAKDIRHVASTPGRDANSNAIHL